MRGYVSRCNLKRDMTGNEKKTFNVHKCALYRVCSFGRVFHIPQIHVGKLGISQSGKCFQFIGYCKITTAAARCLCVWRCYHIHLFT